MVQRLRNGKIGQERAFRRLFSRCFKDVGPFGIQAHIAQAKHRVVVTMKREDENGDRHDDEDDS